MNPRQTAIVLWAGVALVFCMAHPQVRPKVLGLIKAALVPRMVVLACVSLTWITASVYALQRLGAWTTAEWWDTVVFALIGSTALVFKMMNSKDFSAGYYRSLVAEAFGLSAAVNVVADMYAFSLPAELLLIPWLVLLGGVHALANAKDEYQPVRKPVAFVIGLTGVAILLRAVSGAIADYAGFLSISTVRALVLVSLLTIGYMPFLFLVRVWSHYELAYIPVRLGKRKSFWVRTYAVLRLFARHGFNLARLHDFRTGAGLELRFAETRRAVDDVFRLRRESA